MPLGSPPKKVPKFHAPSGGESPQTAVAAQAAVAATVLRFGPIKAPTWCHMRGTAALNPEKPPEVSYRGLWAIKSILYYISILSILPGWREFGAAGLETSSLLLCQSKRLPRSTRHRYHSCLLWLTFFRCSKPNKHRLSTASCSWLLHIPCSSSISLNGMNESNEFVPPVHFGSSNPQQGSSPLCDSIGIPQKSNT